MNDSQSKDNEEGKATNHKSSTREELRNDRQLRRELRKRLKLGEDVSEELLACEGRIKVLEKELTAIEEGGHEVFLAAKETISPKKNYPEKKKELKSKIKDIEKTAIIFSKLANFSFKALTSSFFLKITNSSFLRNLQ